MVAGEKVLVVDSEQASRTRLVELLGQRGFWPTEALSGKEAFKKLQEEDYAVVLLDLVAPGMGGVGMVEKILDLKPEQSIIVMIPPDSAEASAALKRGACSAITKPVQPTELEFSLRNCLERCQLLRMNVFLREETLRDDLTEALNRRYLDRYLDEEIERSRRYKHSFSILFFDLDHLKTVNDRFGHLSGSKVLVEVVALIKTKLRQSDKIFRFGGDEFAVTLPETEQEGAVRTAHRLRRAIRTHRFHPVEESEVSLTASFGVATYPDDGATGEALVRHADEAMYLVKTGSRDGVGVKEKP
ncbi:MAG: diguanylate cyclase [Candidatus Methylomirabilales bacterium]